MRILIVDDEPAISDTLAYALQADGFASDCCTLGAEALARLDAGGHDLVVLDVGLPDISGFDVCRLLRRNSDVPVIFLTARSDEVDRIVGLELGADDYVAKPFSPREVVSRVRAILRRSRPELRNGAGATARRRASRSMAKACASPTTASGSISRVTSTSCWRCCWHVRGASSVAARSWKASGRIAARAWSGPSIRTSRRCAANCGRCAPTRSRS
jgi:DNA-binding response OmpR family regulator